MEWCIIVFCIFLLPFTTAKDELYYTAYKVTSFNKRERILLSWLQMNNNNAYFLNEVTNEAALPMDIIVNKCCNKHFESRLEEYDIQYNYVNISLYQKRYLKKYRNLFYDWEGIEHWVENITKKYSILKKIVIAYTYEKRELFVLKISTKPDKPSIFILGGEQGRDWMPSAIMLNVIEQIMKNEKDVAVLTNYVDLYFLPVFNPDGYEYSIKNETFWARNRKAFFPEKICSGKRIAVGVDIDKNWYFSKSSALSPDAECNPVYIGHKSLSEEEPQGLAQFLNSIAANLMAFINLKGFGRLITIPYARKNEYANNYPLMLELLRSTSETLYQKYNVTYYFGHTADYLFNMTGNSADWVKNKLNVPIVYTVYMKHGDNLLPSPTDVKPLSQQFTTILKETLLITKDIYGPLFVRNYKSHNNVDYYVIAISITVLLYI